MDIQSSGNGKVLALQAVFTLLSTLAIAISGFLLSEVYSINATVKEMSGNRFTSRDGLDVWKELSRIEKMVISVPRDQPPPWFVERVGRLEHRLERIEERLEQTRR